MRDRTPFFCTAMILVAYLHTYTHEKRTHTYTRDFAVWTHNKPETAAQRRLTDRSAGRQGRRLRPPLRVSPFRPGRCADTLLARPSRSRSRRTQIYHGGSRLRKHDPPTTYTLQYDRRVLLPALAGSFFSASLAYVAFAKFFFSLLTIA